MQPIAKAPPQSSTIRNGQGSLAYSSILGLEGFYCYISCNIIRYKYRLTCNFKNLGKNDSQYKNENPHMPNSWHPVKITKELSKKNALLIKRFN